MDPEKLLKIFVMIVIEKKRKVIKKEIEVDIPAWIDEGMIIKMTENEIIEFEQINLEIYI